MSLRRSAQQDPTWQFAEDIANLIWEYRGYSAAILLVTVLQEYAALLPVQLLGQLIDRMETGDLGYVVWLFLGASILAPGITRGNVMLRHKMFYETDLQKRVELTLKVSTQGMAGDAERAGAANSRVTNAVSGITNATYHVLGSITPVIIKIAVVAVSLLTFNRLIGLAYLASLIVPVLLTVLANKSLRVLRDQNYALANRAEGVVVRTIAVREDQRAHEGFTEVLRERKNILFALLCKSQSFLYVREVALVASQFLVVLLALGMRERIGLTPGDLTKIVGYTAQVGVAFITTASCLDSIISYCRAYHVYAREQNALEAPAADLAGESRT
ncbi:MAG: ABC transporter ATP-binding protein [Anaerolineae bacterium]